jgi:hypothetical protein
LCDNEGHHPLHLLRSYRFAKRCQLRWWRFFYLSPLIEDELTLNSKWLANSAWLAIP